jgi:hypothetical protein
MPAARINLSFELSSAVTYMSISAGVIGIGLTASCFSLCCIAGVASTLVAVEWNFSTIARRLRRHEHAVPDGQVGVQITGIERGRDVG